MQVPNCLKAIVLASAWTLPAAAQSSLDWIDRHTGGLQRRFAADCLVDSAGNVYSSGVVSMDFFNYTRGDARLVKYDPSGAMLWSKTRDQFGGYDDSVALCFGPGGLIHELGYCDGAGFPFRPEVFAWDPAGNLVWSTFLPVGLATFEMATSPQGQTVCSGWRPPAGGAMVALNSAGQIQWEVGPLGDGFGSPCCDAQGDWYGIYSYASTPFTPPRAGVTKISASGQVLWSHDYSGVNGAELNRIAVTPNGDSVAVGTKHLSASNFEMFAVAHDSAGTLMWSQTLPGNNGQDSASDVAIDDHGVAWSVGIQKLATPTIVVARYSPSGALLSTGAHSGVAPWQPWEPRLTLGSAGQAYVHSYVESFKDFLLLEVDSSGAVTWSEALPAVPHASFLVAAVALSQQGKLVVAATEDRAMTTLQLDLNRAPQSYCTAKVNSLGCSPKLAFTGHSSAAAASGFTVTVQAILPNRPGLFLYGVNGKAAVPFQGGTLCVQAPIRRGLPANSGGSSGCSGSFGLDFNAFAQGSLGGTPAPALSTPGTAVCCQAWSRDSGFPAPNNSSLSNALRYVVQP